MFGRLRYRLRLGQRYRTLVLLVRRPSSVSDNRSYPALCKRAASNDQVFATFKSQAAYGAILEHVPCSVGSQFLELALRRNPEFGLLLDRFRQNDRIGKPTVCDYGEYGQFSATTLRYVKVLSDLLGLFGALDGMRIAEIGAGYGGQCLVSAQVAQWESYTIIDLAPCLGLAERYLTTHGVPAVRFQPSGNPDAVGPCDLLISNYAFSELRRSVQDRYLDAIIRDASRGYVTCNWMTPKSFRSYTVEELPGLVPNSRLVPEEPLQAKGDVVWIWGT